LAVMVASLSLGSVILTRQQPYRGIDAQKRRRPLNIIVPYGAGGGVDRFARAFAVAAEVLLSVPVVIVNRPGASGLVGAQMAAAARPDGNTLMLTSAGSFLMASMLHKAKVNPFDNFRVVSQIGDLTAGLFVPINSSYQSAGELLDDIRARPKKLRWAHSGRGSFIHVAGLGFLESNGVQVGDVPFKGGANVRTAIISKQVDFGFMGVTAGYGFENKMRALAVASPQRHGVLKDVPTFTELGLDYLNVSSPIVAFAPYAIDEDVLLGLEGLMAKVAARTQFSDLIRATGNLPNYLSATNSESRLRAIALASKPVLRNIGGA